jgi:DNA-binding CsgD family transcriptional regulator
MPKTRAHDVTPSSVLLVRPCGLASSHWELTLTWVYGVALLAVLSAELLTPNDVVTSVALLPLLAAMWTLSTRLAAATAVLAALVFFVSVATEAGNRPTVILIGTVGFVLAVAVRAYAVGLARHLIASRDKVESTVSKRWTDGIALELPKGADALTCRELEVAALAARGYTAAEIGSRLHISDRTVESHLANTYAKLAIHSRSALRGLANRLAP